MSGTIEVFARHPDFPRYVVCADGSVISETGKQMRLLHPGMRGKYRGLTLSDKNGELRGVYLHRLVAEAFLGSAPSGCEVRHLDGDRENNDVDNLCWGTRSQNMRDKELHGTAPKGERHGQAKLTDEKVREMRRLRASGVSVRTLAEQFGMSVMATYRAVIGVSWSHLGE